MTLLCFQWYTDVGKMESGSCIFSIQVWCYQLKTLGDVAVFACYVVLRSISFAKAACLECMLIICYNYHYMCSLVSTLVMLLPSSLHLLVKPGIQRFKLALVSQSSQALPLVSCLEFFFYFFFGLLNQLLFLIWACILPPKKTAHVYVSNHDA